LEDGERIRIGPEFETFIKESGEESEMLLGENRTTFEISGVWNRPSAMNLKLWKKDYERVKALAKGAYNSTSVKEIQAESLFTLARVYHIKQDYENASKFYSRACKLAPQLSPARFGLAQTLLREEEYDEAVAHLRLILGTSSTATDALALLGLLEVRKDFKGALQYLKRAVEFNPLHPELILLEALAMQQQESYYTQSLEKYEIALRLMLQREKVVSYDIYANIGVICHETKKYKKAMEMYAKALKTLEPDDNLITQGVIDLNIKHESNSLFWTFVDSKATIETNTETEVIHLKTVQNSIIPKEGDVIRIGNDNFTTTIEDIKPTSNIEYSFDLRLKNVRRFSNEKVAVQKANRRLYNSLAITIAFNIARLHETTNRLIAAVELHKAIVKLHPAYVNSYLRLACIARDVGSIGNCSEWLRAACKVAPGNAEVLTLVGNLHLSLCDWAPAQSVFEQLLATKEPKVEAYSQLSLGNIYFNNLNTPKKYLKHLGHAADFYRRILQKDSTNAYAANGCGTVLAEKGQLFKAKDVFNQVRGVSGDTIHDTLLNLGHIYLAQKKHPEALQMYQSYMNRTSKTTGAPVSSKSRDDDDAEVLLYLAFAYFDWARQTESFNNTKAAPADERYQKCIQYIELAMKRLKKENVILRYNWCRTKLQVANCVLQKITRNIRRSAAEVKDALGGLEESLPVVQKLLAWKTEGKKVPIPTLTLQDFIQHCKGNIESAKSHLLEEVKKEKVHSKLREAQLRKEEALAQEKLQLQQKKDEEDLFESEKREQKAKAKMQKARSLQENWEQQAIQEASIVKSKNKKKKIEAPKIQDDEDLNGIFENDVTTDGVAVTTSALFDDSESESDTQQESQQNVPEKKETIQSTVFETEADLFGASSSEEESDEELVSNKRKNEDIEEDDKQDSQGNPKKVKE